MTRVAYLTASCMIAGSPDERADAWEHAAEMRALVPACAARGIQLEEAVWNDPALPVQDYAAFVIGTTWDYQEQTPAFLARLEELEAHAPVLNSLQTVRWNLHKRYLNDLEDRGLRIVPTAWVEQLTAAQIEAQCAAWGCDAVVVKPGIGAGAWRQARIERGAPLPPAEELPPVLAHPLGHTMVQPFLPSIQTEGELSFLFFDRQFSHCLRKRPQPGDYRVQALYGGAEEVHPPSEEEMRFAQSVAEALGDELLYARVDLVRLPDQQLAVIELELIEPYLYPEQGPNLGRLMARAVAGRLKTPA